jgi:hypothetical protein
MSLSVLSQEKQKRLKKKQKRHYDQFCAKLVLKSRQELLDLLFHATGAVAFLTNQLKEKNDQDNPPAA